MIAIQRSCSLLYIRPNEHLRAPPAVFAPQTDPVIAPFPFSTEKMRIEFDSRPEAKKKKRTAKVHFFVVNLVLPSANT